MASELAGVCINREFTIGPLNNPGDTYFGPPASSATACRCSSVYYSLLSACATCQGRNYLEWSEYNANCTTVFVATFPQMIPDGMGIPSYAYQDMPVGGTFNISQAMADDGPEATGTGEPAQTSGAAADADDGGGTNVGAIAGGVIGGVVFLAIVGILVFFFLKKRKKEVAPSAIYSAAPPAPPISPPPMTAYTDGSDMGSMPAAKVYNPNDPSTWPTNQPAVSGGPMYGGHPNNAGYMPPMATGQTAISGTTAYTQSPTYGQPAAPPGRYTGVAEL